MRKLETKLYSVRVLHDAKELSLPDDLAGMFDPPKYYTLRLREINKPSNTMVIRVYNNNEMILFLTLESILKEHSKFPCKLKEHLPGMILSRKYNVFLFGSEVCDDIANAKLTIAKWKYKEGITEIFTV